jgi:3-methylfumaryl-CoA hydratase
MTYPPETHCAERLDAKRVAGLLAVLPSECHQELPPGIAPTGAHLLLFGGFPGRVATGEDGHALAQGAPPGLEGMARMYAGGNIQFLAPIPIDSMVTRVERIEEIKERNGRSGKLVFVTLGASYLVADRLVIEERRNIVYRDKRPHRAQVCEPAPAHTCIASCRFDAIDLFRFSALTFNSHRIHYDVDYAREVEHYPALVVHGPLLAATLLGLAGSPKSFEFRLLRPSFAGEELHFAQATADEHEWMVVGADGSARLTATTQPDQCDTAAAVRPR